MQHLIIVRAEPPGQFTAEAVGIPEIRATSTSRESAIQQVRGTLAEWLTKGQLESVVVPDPNPVLKYAGWAKNDPLYDEYLEELARARQEDLERTLKEYEQECSDSSSTPTT